MFVFDDEELFAAAAGDASAWDHLVDQNLADVWEVLMRSGLDENDAADVCEVVWLRLAQSLSVFRSASDVSRWLVAVAEVEARRLGRRRAAEAGRVTRSEPDNVIRLAPGFAPSAVASPRPIFTA